VITACETGCPRYSSAACFSFWSTIAEISGGVSGFGWPSTLMVTRWPSGTTWYGTIFISSPTSSNRRPMKRLIEKTVFSGLVTACRLATCPTRRSPDLVNATTDGVSRPPSGFVITTGSPPSMTATTELVVPKSIPMILLIQITSYVRSTGDIDLSIKPEWQVVTL
jgi:hypothetical protein